MPPVPRLATTRLSGVNATWVAITANMFGLAGEGTYAGVKYAGTLDKALLLAGGSPTMTTFPTRIRPGGGIFELHPHAGPELRPGEPRLYIVDNPYLVQNGVVPVLRLSQISGTGAAPVWSVTSGSALDGSGLFAVAHAFNERQIGGNRPALASTCSAGVSDGAPCLDASSCAEPGACRRIDSGVFAPPRPGFPQRQDLVHALGRPASRCVAPRPHRGLLVRTRSGLTGPQADAHRAVRRRGWRDGRPSLRAQYHGQHEQRRAAAASHGPMRRALSRPW